MAPEISKKGTRHNESVDIWSTCCLAYYLLTSRFPYASSSDSRPDCMYKIAPDFSKLTESQKDFLSKGLAMESKHRSSAKELIRHAWLAALNTEAPVPQNAEFDNCSESSGQSKVTRSASLSPSSINSASTLWKKAKF